MLRALRLVAIVAGTIDSVADLQLSADNAEVSIGQVLGRLGTFGLSAMKTKADRMWLEFSQALVARIGETPLAAL